MNTSRSLLRMLSVMVAGGWLICAATGFAAPGGASGFGTAASASAGGGHAVSAAPTGGGHSAHISGGFAARPAMSAGSSFHPSGGSIGNAGIAHASGGIGPMLGFSTGPHASMAQAGTAHPSIQMPIQRNAWTDPSNPRLSSSVSTTSRQSGLTNGTRTGSNLYPGSYGYMPTRPASGHLQHGPTGGYSSDHYHRRGYYNNFPYPVYYPYPYNNYVYGGIADYSGLTTDNNAATELGAPDFTNTPNNYYSYVEPDQTPVNTNASSTPDQPLPDAPDVGPQTPAPNDKSTINSQGPDSLVEAVQDELSRRGYFAGRADSMYGPATKEAIRRFQADQKLPATGLINEATLHALHLD